MRARSRQTWPILLIFVLFTACSGAGGGSPGRYANTVAQISDYIEWQRATYGINAVSIALVDDQQVVWARGFGYADAAGSVPTTANTQFEICSVSKIFGGTLIMQLSDQGKLDIGDSLTKYIPTFSIGQPLGFTVTNPQPITIRSMLTHHSGIPGDIMNWSTTAAFDSTFNDRLIAYLQGDYLAYPTNFMMDYSNSAVALLSSVIVSASGQTFETYSEALFQALGMDHSSFYRSSPKISGFQAAGFSQGVAQPSYMINVTTAGSIISSANDMAKFIKMVLANGMGERQRVLNASTLEQMLTRTNGGMPLDSSSIGLSWFLSDAQLDYAGRLCWHNGQSDGFVSHLEILREHKLGVIVLVNDGNRNDACSAIALQALKLALAEKTGITAPAPVPQTYGALVTWDQAALDALQGTYVLSSTDSGKGYITVQSVAGALEWTNPVGATIHIAPRENGWLSSPTSPSFECEFVEIDGRRILRVHQNGQTQLYAEYAGPVAIPAAWSARVGSYTATNWVSVEPAPPLLLAVENGMLVMTTNENVFVLAAVSDTLAYVRGLGRQRGSAVKVMGPDEIQFLGVSYQKI